MTLQELKEEKNKEKVELIKKMVMEQVKDGLKFKKEIIKLYKNFDSKGNVRSKSYVFNEDEKRLTFEILKQMNINYKILKERIYIYIGDDKYFETRLNTYAKNDLRNDKVCMAILSLLFILVVGLMYYLD